MLNEIKITQALILQHCLWIRFLRSTGCDQTLIRMRPYQVTIDLDDSHRQQDLINKHYGAILDPCFGSVHDPDYQLTNYIILKTVPVTVTTTMTRPR